jgi:uroporphyrinogen-III decarboxylase
VDHDTSMHTGAIRKRYPDLVLWGTISADLLRRAEPVEIYRQCRQIIADSGGRGYFHGCSNAVLPGTPPENVWAMMRARDGDSREDPSLSAPRTQSTDP